MQYKHVLPLPPRFVKIRYFGFLFHRDKHRNIALLRSLMDAPADPAKAPPTENAQQIMLRLIGIDIHGCPHCGKGQMIVMVQDPERQPHPGAALTESGFPFF